MPRLSIFLAALPLLLAYRTIDSRARRSYTSYGIALHASTARGPIDEFAPTMPGDK